MISFLPMILPESDLIGCPSPAVLWVDDTRSIVGDYYGVLYMWSFEPQDD